jgi:predicted dehydrogenase
MTSKNNISVGLIGCGHWGKYILRDLVSLGCDVPVVARSGTSRANATNGGCSLIVDHVDELPKLDGAVIATPTGSHFALIKQLVKRNIPIFVEKPLTASVTQAEALREYSDKLFVMDKWRYHQGILALARLAQNGDLGTLQSLQCIRWGWRTQPRDIDAVWYLAPHDLAIALEILGHLPEVQFARFESYENEPSGCIAFLGKRPWVEINVSERRESHFRQIRLHGDQGIAILRDSYSPEIELYSFPARNQGGKPAIAKIPISEDMPLLSELQKFVQYLRGAEPPKSNFEDAITIVYALHQIHEQAV